MSDSGLVCVKHFPRFANVVRIRLEVAASFGGDMHFHHLNVQQICSRQKWGTGNLMVISSSRGDVSAKTCFGDVNLWTSSSRTHLVQSTHFEPEVLEFRATPIGLCAICLP